MSESINLFLQTVPVPEKQSESYGSNYRQLQEPLYERYRENIKKQDLARDLLVRELHGLIVNCIDISSEEKVFALLKTIKLKHEIVVDDFDPGADTEYSRVKTRDIHVIFDTNEDLRKKIQVLQVISAIGILAYTDLPKDIGPILVDAFG